MVESWEQVVGALCDQGWFEPWTIFERYHDNDDADAQCGQYVESWYVKARRFTAGRLPSEDQ